MNYSNNIVMFDGVKKSYDGESYVVKDLNFGVERGEFLTLLGPSGSGKTTTLMMLAGFETPTQGEISLNGNVLNKIPPYKRDIGMIFQNYALFPHMTVAENVAFPLKMRKISSHEVGEKVKKSLDMVHLKGLADRMPSQLSGGQQQRVAIARALVFNPKLVLLDEPLGALDKNLRQNMQLELKHIHENLGVTMVFVTHDQDEALTMSDRIAIFNDGVIQQAASPNEIYNWPKNSFVAKFVGETNFFQAKVVSSNIGKNHIACEIMSGEVFNVYYEGRVKEKTNISLFVRPENIRLESLGVKKSENDNSIKVKIEDVNYHGDHSKVTLVGDNDIRLVSKISSAYGYSDLSGLKEAVFKASDCKVLEA
ncbi:ABC transporter ATP-binding protein [Halomonas sp. KAO]|uniref:ABC transporter ATP-binding protein n=1 Tax=Halomonas sp. KAO TaxID=2783858 RepID=UPI00189E4BB8|nr:ABC transporter ATP-binding protein [Halomonas sp. KAO]MBF7052849.1 ABC transporter ATP-binding protein [Halomonas sp. KAO]